MNTNSNNNSITTQQETAQYEDLSLFLTLPSNLFFYEIMKHLSESDLINIYHVNNQLRKYAKDSLQIRQKEYKKYINIQNDILNGKIQLIENDKCIIKGDMNYTDILYNYNGHIECKISEYKFLELFKLYCEQENIITLKQMITKIKNENIDTELFNLLLFNIISNYTFNLYIKNFNVLNIILNLLNDDYIMRVMLNCCLKNNVNLYKYINENYKFKNDEVCVRVNKSVSMMACDQNITNILQYLIKNEKIILFLKSNDMKCNKSMCKGHNLE